MKAILYLLIAIAMTPIIYLWWIGFCLLLSRIPALSFAFAACLTLIVRGLSKLALLLAPNRFQEFVAIARTAHLITQWPLPALKKFLQEYRELETLPTIKQGMRDFGIQSLFETFWRRDVLHRRNPALISPLQRPIIFIPGIRATAFYSSSLYPWISDAVQLIPKIQQELEGVQRKTAGFEPYHNEFGLTTHPFAKSSDGSTKKYAEHDWNMYFFYRGGKEIASSHSQCPVTSTFLKGIPELEKTMVCFSLLRPGVWVPPHFGLTNAIVRIHIPLVVPDECFIRVGREIRQWHEGIPLLFDDSFEHEVWNKSQQTRVVLFINAFHPIFSQQERVTIARFLSVSLARSPAVAAWRGFIPGER